MYDTLEEIARAVLYEGYILWPYRRSALKNAQRWTFGGVYPRAFAEASGTNDRWWIEAQCLLEAAPGASIEAHVRFLQVVERRVSRLAAGRRKKVDELIVAGERYATWQEATERRVSIRLQNGTDCVHAPIRIDAGGREELLFATTGEAAGAIERSWRALEGEITMRTQLLRDTLFRITLRVANTGRLRRMSRNAATMHAFMSAHIVLSAPNGDFVSAQDPPEHLRTAAAECVSSGVWPVLAGDEGQRHTMLCPPIILYDYPRVAPESPGDLFDGGEIDQLLTLNILALTDDEREAMRAADPRTKKILDRTMNLSRQELGRLHGTLRNVRSLGAK